MKRRDALGVLAAGAAASAVSLVASPSEAAETGERKEIIMYPFAYLHNLTKQWVVAYVTSAQGYLPITIAPGARRPWVFVNNDFARVLSAFYWGTGRLVCHYDFVPKQGQCYHIAEGLQAVESEEFGEKPPAEAISNVPV